MLQAATERYLFGLGSFDAGAGWAGTLTWVRRIAMQTRIQGTTMPVFDVLLDPNESVFSESGELSWMTGSIQMTTHTQMGGGGGIFGVLKRVAGGGSIFMTEYRAVQYPGEVSFATKVPGHIGPVE